MSLFPGAEALGGNRLYQIKAGKCEMVLQADGKYMVTPDKCRGLIAIIRSNDGLIHFKWNRRASNTSTHEADDCVVFPDDVVFKKVNTGRSTDRVYMLKWSQSNKQLMFWMQDLNADKDEEMCTKLNDCIKNPHLYETPAPPLPPMDARTAAIMQMLG